MVAEMGAEVSCRGMHSCLVIHMSGISVTRSVLRAELLRGVHCCAVGPSDRVFSARV